MIATFFQWRIRAGREAEFAAAWREVTLALRAQGSNGSALFDGPDDTLCAVARWPDRAARDAAFATFAPSAAAQRLNDATESTLQRFDMDERDNLWTPLA